MAQLPVINFSHAKNPSGYRLVWRDREMKPLAEQRKGATLYVARNEKASSTKEVVRPLDVSSDLYLTFAHSAVTPEGVLSFVQQHGPLTFDGYDAELGDNVELIIFNARQMRESLKAVEAHKAPQVLSLKIGLVTGISLLAAVVWDTKMSTCRWQFQPRTLLDGLWLQFGQVVTRGDAITHCKHCGTLFESGRGTGRRAGAKFCCDDHKTAFHSLKRGKEN